MAEYWARALSLVDSRSFVNVLTEIDADYLCVLCHLVV